MKALIKLGYITKHKLYIYGKDTQIKCKSMLVERRAMKEKEIVDKKQVIQEDYFISRINGSLKIAIK